ncbi:MAG: hypothetical protein IKQ17_10585 [Kiritimatiellae bacterium]|nr:hypothetical protein [Kiritimatiellia bacterium]
MEINRDPILLAAYIREHVKGRGRFYVLIDEIQLSLKVRKPGVKGGGRGGEPCGDEVLASERAASGERCYCRG